MTYVDEFDDGFFSNADIKPAEVNENGNVVVSRLNLERYRRFLANVPEGTVATVDVPTGEIIPEHKTDKNGNLVLDDLTGKPVVNINRGRGRSELEAQRGLRLVANQELGLGIDIRHQHLNNGKTQLRLAMHKKRTFTDEQNAKREAARKAGLVRRTQNRIAQYKVQIARNPNDAGAKDKLAKAEASLAKLAPPAPEANPPKPPVKAAPAKG